MDYMDVLMVILSVLGSILLVVSIILVIKLIKTINKINLLLDDINYKVEKLDGVFTIVDKTTDAIADINDRLVNMIVSGVSKLFKRKKRKDD